MRARMCMTGSIGLAAVVCLVAVACGGGSAAGSSPGTASNSPVPSDVAQEVHDQYGSRGFIPTRVPDGYGFRNWVSEGAGGFNMYFGASSAEEMQFGVDETSCPSATTSMHTFEANAVAVEWSATDEDQQAWRCLTVDGTQLMLMASRSVPGDDSLDTPAQLQDAQQLVDLVAYAEVAQ